MSRVEDMGKDLPRGITRRRDGKLLAQVYSRIDAKRKSKVFGARELALAKNWRRDTQTALAKGEIVVGRSPTLRKASELFLDGIRNGTIRTRSRQRYKPSTIARYNRALEAHLLPELGSLKLDEIRPGKLTDFVGKLQATGLAANSVRNAFMPLQSIYRWAVLREYVAVDPTAAVELPIDRSRRDRFAPPAEVSLLLAALEVKDRALWATAFYTGLRRGELMALRWIDVDLATCVISVEQSHDPEAHVTGSPKSEQGIRRVPLPGLLRDVLLDHRLRSYALPNPHPLVFSRRSLDGNYRAGDGPFSGTSVSQRARRRWAAQGLQPVSLHECRHTFASLMIAAMTAAGKFNPKRLQDLMGHSSITTTYDRYGHLMPGDHGEAALQLEAYLDADAAARQAELEEARHG